MKIKDILSIDTATLRTIDLKQLQRIVKQAQNYSKRRLKNIEEKGLQDYSPAYQTWADKLLNTSQNRTSKNRLRLISDLRNAQIFLSDKTSTVRNTRSYKAKMKKLLPNIAEGDYARFWKAVDAIRESQRIQFTQLQSSSIINLLQAAWDVSKSFEETLTQFEEIFHEEYDRSNAEYYAREINPDDFRGELL